MLQRQMTVDSVADQYRLAAVFVDPANIPDDIVRDPKDRKVLACAVGGKAEFIVSGDNDLLDLGTHEGVAIVNSGKFLKSLLSESK